MQQILVVMSIGLLLAACGPLNQLMGNQNTPQPAPVIAPPQVPPPTNSTPANSTPNPIITPPPTPPAPNVTPPGPAPVNNTQTAQQVWGEINQKNAETECLTVAKALTGMYASMQRCACDEVLSVGVKNYVCTITTPQGGIPVDIYCKLSTQSCAWTSGNLSQNMTFDQVQQYLQTG